MVTSVIKVTLNNEQDSLGSRRTSFNTNINDTYYTVHITLWSHPDVHVWSHIWNTQLYLMYWYIWHFMKFNLTTYIIGKLEIHCVEKYIHISLFSSLPSCNKSIKRSNSIVRIFFHSQILSIINLFYFQNSAMK